MGRKLAQVSVATRMGVPVRGAVRHWLASDYFVLALAAVYFAAMTPVLPELVQAHNLNSLLTSMLPLLIVTVGQTFVLITGGIDLSVTSTMALSSVLSGALMTSSLGAQAGETGAAVLGVTACAAVAAGVGAVNGLAVSRLRMPPFIVTLATMMFFSGAAIWYTRSTNIGGLPGMFTKIGQEPALAVLLAMVVAGFGHVVLVRSAYGRWFYAVGQNSRTALVSGVPVQGVVFAAYIVSGICAALAAVVYTGRLETASPVLGQRLLLDIVAASVIGGTSLFGGRGGIPGTVCGVLFLTIIDNSLNLLGLSHFAIMIAKGVVILAAAVLDAGRARVR